MSNVNPKRFLIRNVVSNWAAIIVSVLIGFLLSPYLVHSLGKEDYGVLALVMSIITYLEFLDVGMRQSLARYLPKYYALRDYQGLNEIANSSSLIYAVIASTTALATFVIAFFFVGVFNVSPGLTETMKVTIIILGLSEAFTFLMITWSAMGPFHRYDLLNTTNVLRAIINALAVVYFVDRGHGIIAIAMISLVLNVIFTALRMYLQRRIVPELRFSISCISKERIRELIGYGIMSLLIVISTIVVFCSDNIIVGMFLSTTAVTYYSIAGNLIHQLRMLVSSIGVPLVPAISHLDASSNSDQILSLFRKLSAYLYYILTFVCVCTFLFGGRFISLWMGPDFDQSFTILKILILPACIYFPQTVASSVLQGMGKIRQLLYMVIGEAVSKIVLSVILVQYFGIYGVAIGTVAPQSIIYLFIYPRLFHSIVGGSVFDFYKQSLKAVATCLIIALPVGYAAYQFVVIDGWPGLIINVTLTGTAALAGFFGYTLAVEDRDRIVAKTRSLLAKVKRP